MMSIGLLPVLIAAQSGEISAQKLSFVSPQVVSVSLFKNGYCFVTRRIPITGAQTNIIEVPQASLGTLWFWTPAGELKSISTASTPEVLMVDSSVTSLLSALKLNIGKVASVELKSPNSTVYLLEGKIKSCDGEALIIETAKGVSAVPTGSVISVSSVDKEFKWTQKIESKSDKKFYQLNTVGSKEVMMMSLEKGATWAPAYAVDIGDPEKLTFASKAIILNDTLNMPKSNLRLITGFPNLQFKDMLDPFSSNMTADNWVNSLAGPVAFPTAGGLGGGGRGGLMSQNAYGAMEDKTVEWGGANAGESGGEQIGDLFFYDLPNFELKKGIRTYQSLFKFDSSYEHIYTWDIADQVDPSGVYRAIPANQPQVEEVWHTVKFKNSSGKPLTTAVATIFSKGELIGQTTLDYSAVGSDCKVRINKALDVRADANEEEVERQRGAIKDQYNNPKFDLVTVKGLLEVTNARKEEVQMTIVKNLTGEYLSGTGNPQQVKTTKGLRQMNPSMKLTWKPKVKGNGEKLRLEYSYKLYVPSN
jgi:hypothetical protein